MSANPSPDVIQFPVRTNAELAAESSDRLLRETSTGWVEHFALYGNQETAEGVYRFVCRVKLRMERERGFGKK
jgi:hypothetical protein